MSLTTVDFRRLHLAPGQRILDLGCGEGRHAITAWLTAPAHVVGLDLEVRQRQCSAGLALRTCPHSPPSLGDGKSDCGYV